MKSQLSAMSQPRPVAAPLTAAMVGLGRLCSRETAWWTRCWRFQPLKATEPAGALMRACMPLISPPAQKPLPVPVRISALISLSAAMRSRCSISSVRMSSLMALRASGRFSVRVAMLWVTDSSMGVVDSGVVVMGGLSLILGLIGCPDLRQA